MLQCVFAHVFKSLRCDANQPNHTAYIYIYDYAYYYKKKNARPDARMNKATSGTSRRIEENDNIQITCCRCIIMHARVGLFDIKHNDVLCVPHARITTSLSSGHRSSSVRYASVDFSVNAIFNVSQTDMHAMGVRRDAHTQRGSKTAEMSSVRRIDLAASGVE